MPKTPAQHQDVGLYLSGYTDGEGSFCVSFSPRPKLRTHLEVRPSFSVSQNGDRCEVLDMFLEHFHCGSIRRNPSDKTYKYEVRSLRDLIEKIVPHFEHYPLFSSKQKDFEKFKLICGWMKDKKHVNKSTLVDIIQNACSMNSSGTRKYRKEHLLRLIV
ncbi:LAGLIDADG family homing endonuclease [Candidatus Gottesmanbacteria bacterium]|nr:LAGLIDADG family homing endonuclease [Candidatus Gottesmanbacteria bacterium]